MKYCFLFPVLLFMSVQSNAQNADAFVQTLRRLDSIQHSNTIARHFGGLYFEFLEHIEAQLQYKDSANKQLVTRFESVFAHFYIEAANAYNKGEPLPEGVWGHYFTDTGLELLQYKLLGANAHLNGELWQALTESFTAAEMTQVHAEFSIFKRTMNGMYHQIYHDACMDNNKVLAVHVITIGASEWIGNMYLYKWINRQMKIAELYWAQSPGCEKLQERTRRRKNFVDKLVVRVL